MNERLWQREHAYRRRLCIVTPIAAVVVAFLFLGSDRFSFQEIEQQIGWKGELRLMPEITIIPDDDESNITEQERQLVTMATVDLDLPEGEDIDSPEFANVDRPDEVEQLDYAEWDRFKIRTIEQHRDVPYSEDYVIIKMVEPEYPEAEMKAGIEGNVLVELLVGDDGRVVDAAVLSRAGPKSFADASLEAVRQFVFQPPVERGKPTTMWIKFVIRFRMFS
jgi:TonB family protein